jgi:hypothetical protein
VLGAHIDAKLLPVHGCYLRPRRFSR